MFVTKAGGAKAMTYNTTHLEIQEGERFLGNMDKEGFRSTGWNTKRKGEVAFDIHGNVIKHSDLFPVFMQKEEYDIGMKVLRKEQNK